MPSSFTFEPAIRLSKSGGTEFWVYSLEKIEQDDRVEVDFSLGTIGIDRWNGHVFHTEEKSFGSVLFWMAGIRVSYVPPPSGTPVSSSGDLINVSITITSHTNPHNKQERRAVPAISKT